MKPTNVWSALRKGLDPTLKELGFRRVRPSPPVYTRELEDGSHLTLWFKMKSTGGTFIGALQRAPEPKPGIEWMAGTFTSRRLPDLFDDAGWERIRRIHAEASRKLGESPGEPSCGSDYWFTAADESDVSAWAALLAERLPQMIERLDA